MSNLFIDYAIFGLLIIATFVFNVYNNVSGPKEKTKADYVFASGSSASTWAMLLSISRGFLGVRVFLGYPSELFYRGSEMWETVYGMCLAFPVVAYFFVPLYFSLGITSVYQYLDMRFNSRLVRCLASSTYVIRSLLNLGVTVFTPCVALKTIVGMPYLMSITGISILGILFTVMGGLRSAIMIDVLQGVAMILCSIVVIIQGTLTAKDGPLSVIETPYERGRLDFFRFNLDPTLRVTTLSAVLGQFFMSLSLYGCQQNFVQRYLSMKTEEKVKKTLWLNVPFTFMLISLSWIVGMVIFSHYADCDPRILGYITDIDEILPFYIEDKFVFLPGFLGLSMACLFNGGLSFLVSNLNSLSTVVWEDFLLHFRSCKNLNDKKQVRLIKLIAVFLGLCVMGISFIVSHFSGVIESSMLMTSASSGPLLGVFILAMFVPIANWKGASVGMIISHILVLWITINSLMVEKPPIEYLPTTIDQCSNDTFSQHISPAHLIETLQAKFALSESNETDLYMLDEYKDTMASGMLDLKVTPTKDEDLLAFLYRITYMYYALFGTITTVVVGTVVSYVTGKCDQYEYSETLIHPWVKKMRCWVRGDENKSLQKLPPIKTKHLPNSSEKVDFPSQKFLLNTVNEKKSDFTGISNIAFVSDVMGQGLVTSR